MGAIRTRTTAAVVGVLGVLAAGACTTPPTLPVGAQCEPLELVPGADLTNCNLQGMDLSGVDLHDAILTNANLTHANLDGANLDHTIAIAGQFQYSSMVGTTMRDSGATFAKFHGAALTGVDFTGSTLDGATFGNFLVAGHSDITGAKFTNVDLRNVITDGWDLAIADFSGTNLSGKTLTTNNLAGAHLSRARLQHVHIEGSNASGADLSHADLFGAAANATDLSGANLSSASLDTAVLDLAKLVNADLTGASLLQVLARQTDFTGATLTGAVFGDPSDFTGAICPSGAAYPGGDPACLG